MLLARRRGARQCIFELVNPRDMLDEGPMIGTTSASYARHGDAIHPYG